MTARHVPALDGAWEPASRRVDLPSRLPQGARTFRTIESHTAGNPTRTVLSGVPEPAGTTMLERMADLATNHDWVRCPEQDQRAGVRHRHRGMDRRPA